MKNTIASIVISPSQTIRLRLGKHGRLVKAILEDFAPRFAAGFELVYARSSGSDESFYAWQRLNDLCVTAEKIGGLPDLVLYCLAKDRLFLVECVTGHGPIDEKRHDELSRMFKNARSELVFVSSFPSREIMSEHMMGIPWGTEAWCAQEPEHLIHFNSDQLLGPQPVNQHPVGFHEMPDHRAAI